MDIEGDACMIGFFVGLILGGSFGALFMALFWTARGRKESDKP